MGIAAQGGRMTSLPNIQDGPSLGTITCADDLVLDDVAEWVAELLKEMQLIKRFYDLDQRGFFVGDHFVTVGEGA
jgi:hypothetical protein